MYLIRLPTGEEAVYRSIEELALAVHSGVVGPAAQAYHRATSEWLPIADHPEYQAALAIHVPEPVLSEPLPEAPALAPTAAEPVAENPVSRSAPRPRTGSLISEGRASKLRRMLMVTFSVILLGSTGIGIGFGLQLLWSRMKAKPSSSSMTEGMEPDPGLTLRAQTALFALDSSIAAAAQALSAPARTADPKRHTVNPALSPTEAGYLEAREQLDSSLVLVNFRRLFSPTRLRDGESVRQARRVIDGAANVFRVYWGQEVMLEQTDPRPNALAFRETYETTETARELLTDLDSLFSILGNHVGGYSIQNDTIAFLDMTAAHDWEAVRNSLLRKRLAWQDSSEVSGRVSIPRILHAFNDRLPPLARR